ncbi:dienelactone hydrolase family protein [Agreia sp. COWG]|uniref:dienelactone hydrolase family protein n=1 Tax=Agreia sp. COWG TaxID=2773266 RepID=UPI0019289851|nr:dienelactone hydrolase family protein [Agreia sp. COWG]CAD6009577.1 DLH domain-containing protein [Agreia sp. COWG]
MTQLVDIPSPGWPLTFGEQGLPSVVLVHDDYGRLPYLESYATALAKQGFFVVVPDLFNGIATVDDEGVALLRSRLDEGFAMATIDDAIDLGRGHGASRVGLIGMGLGGRLALRSAQAGAVDAVISYYAGLAESEGGIVPCPVALHFSEFDDWGSGLDADLFVSRLKEVGTPVTRHQYIGTGTFFANATISATLDKNAAALAFARSTYFMQAQLLD